MNSEFKHFNESELEKNEIRLTNNFGDDLLNNEEFIEKYSKSLKNEFKEKAYIHYQNNGNLNDLIFSIENKEIKRKLEKWMHKFYLKNLSSKKIISAKSYLNSQDEDKFSNTIFADSSFRMSPNHSKYKQNYKNNNSKKAKVERSRLKEKDLIILKNMLPLNNKEVDREQLDFDDSIQQEIQIDFEENKDDILINNLGNNLHRYKEDSNNIKGNEENDNFNMLLELMRRKKKHLKEINPYYVDKYNFKNEMLFYIDYEDVYEDPSNVNVDDFINEYLNLNS